MLPTVPTLALTCLALLSAGYVILGILSLSPRFRAFMPEAWPLLMTETLIVASVAGAIWIGGVVLDLALLSLVFRCMWEAAQVARLRCPHAMISSAVLAGGVAFAAFLASYLPLTVAALLLVTVCAAATFPLDRIKLHSDPNIHLMRSLILFPTAPLILLAAAGLQGIYGSWLLVAFIFVETFDSYALGGGKVFGRTKAFPTLSPRKTVEGLVFGAAALMLTAALAGPVFGLPMLACAGVALLSGALTITGDLAASALKRRCAVKDFPAVLPHQGGVLDIADAWIVTGAGLAVLAALTGLG